MEKCRMRVPQHEGPSVFGIYNNPVSYSVMEKHFEMFLSYKPAMKF